ncbi:hypothetical protein J4Q44_G00032160 [Coregonus suidteri]|uniref:Uncharacterized protein n=1 Tax=Coregonus suidteri TaxID=861788 RepID=A0AAN8NH91_9TELE
MRREYRLYTDDSGNLLFPNFDINTTAPKEILRDAELKLALVTNSLDLIFLKMQPGAVPHQEGVLGALQETMVIRAEVSTLFGMKHTKCMKAIQRNSPTIFMGFNMS